MRGFTKLILAAALGAAALAPGAAQAWNGPWDGPRHWGPPRVYYAPPPPPVYYVPPRPVFLPPPPPRHWGPPAYYAPPRHWGPPPGHWRHHRRHW